MGIENLATLIDGPAANVPALIDGDNGAVVTYGQLRTRCAATRQTLVDAGLEPGDRVALVAPTTVETVVAALATTGAGMIVVLLNDAHPETELRREIEQTTPRAILSGSASSATGLSATFDADLPVLPIAGDSTTGSDGPPIVDVDDDTIAMLFFTSGTAGFPKAAMLSHRNLSFVQETLIAQEGSAFRDTTVSLVPLPLSHIYGMNVSVCTTLRAGGTAVLVRRFSPTKAIALIREHQVTAFAGVPPMWPALLAVESAGPDDFASVERIASGASALRPAVWHAFKDRFHVELSEGYGLTETASGCTVCVTCENRPGSVGFPLPGTEVKIVNLDGVEVPPHDSGTIVVRGPHVFRGYWNNDEATKLVLDDDGWLNTGDIGVVDDEGYFHIVDRAKDLIIVSGFNVYPQEVEAVVVQHPAIAQAIVVGADDEQRGERVIAHVTLEQGAIAPELDELVDFCRDGLARYKCPSELYVHDELPISPAGKQLRRALDDMTGGSHGT